MVAAELLTVAGSRRAGHRGAGDPSVEDDEIEASHEGTAMTSGLGVARLEELERSRLGWPGVLMTRVACARAEPRRSTRCFT